jgi:hypothetical protein
MNRTNIYLEDRQTEALDRFAGEEGVSRAEVIRRIIDRGIGAGDDTLASDLAAIDRSFGVLADLGDPFRAPGEREAWLERMWAQ